jgi:3-hydroxyisobutyrate dehydrogenase
MARASPEVLCCRRSEHGGIALGAPTIGFIGLGTMGLPMTLNLLAKGHRVAIWGRRRERLQQAAAAGATLADSAASLAGAADVIALCVTDTEAVEAVIFGPGGVAAGGAPGKLIVDHSTIHPLKTREFATRLREKRGMGWVDAPVSGGETGAKAGTLIVMAGGDEGDVARAEPVMRAYASRITRMGPVGAGQATKVCNQMIIGAEVAAIAEALRFAHDFGVEARRLPDCLAGGWADSKVLQDHGRRMAAADYARAGDAHIMLKDMGIACDMGRSTKTPMPVAGLVASLYALLIAQGHSDKGQIGLMRLYADGPL